MLNAEQPTFATLLEKYSMQLCVHPSLVHLSSREFCSRLQRFQKRDASLGLLVVEGALEHSENGDCGVSRLGENGDCGVSRLKSVTGREPSLLGSHYRSSIRLSKMVDALPVT